MNRRDLLSVVGASAVGAAIPLTPAAAAGDERARWAAKAQALVPALHETGQLPLSLVRATSAPELPLRFRMETHAPASELAKRVLRYDPAQPLSSPYGDIHINSFCHAWSCTPSYLLRSGMIT